MPRKLPWFQRAMAHFCVALMLFQSTGMPLMALGAEFGNGERLSASEMASIKGGASSPNGGKRSGESDSGCVQPELPEEKDNAPARDPVLMSGGKFAYPVTEVVIPGPGRVTDHNLRFERTYSSQGGYYGVCGAGWFTNIDVFIEDLAGAGVILVFHDNDGFVYPFLRINPGFDDNLYGHGEMKIQRQENGSFLLTKKYGTQYKFNANGEPKWIQDKKGSKISYLYDDPGGFVHDGDQVVRRYPSAMVDDAGQTLTFEYHLPDGVFEEGQLDRPLLKSVTDPRGRQWSYTYNLKDRMKTSTDARGNVTTYKYHDANDPNNITAIVDPRGNVMHFDYNNQDQVVRQTNPDGGETQLSYNNFLGTSSMIDENGNTWSFEYNAAGLTTLVIDPEGGVNHYTYNDSNLRASHTDPLGRVTSYEYDDNSNLVKVTDPNGRTVLSPYNLDHNLWTSMTDQNGHVVTRVLGNNGNIDKVIDPLGKETVFTYNSRGQLLTSTDRNGNTTTMAYDIRGNLTSTTDALGNITQFDYDTANRLTSTTDAKGRVTQFKYNRADRITEVTRPDGSIVSMTYDDNNNLLTTTDPLGHITTMAYNSRDLVETQTDALGNTTSFVYDLRKNLVQVTDAKARATVFAYDKTDRRISATDPLSGSTTFQYDLAGRLLNITDAKGQQTAYQYDNLDRLTRRTYPDASFEAMTYDFVGNTLTHVTRAGETIEMAYDANNRMVSKGCPSCGASFVYDDEGNTTQVNDAVAGIFTYTYDKLNRVKQSGQPGNQLVKYQYDEVGLRKKLTYPDNTQINYLYDNLNQLQRIVDGTSEYNFNYDSANRRKALIYPNGIKMKYEYDNANRLTQVAVRNPADTDLITRYDYTLDQVGNWTSMATKIPGKPLSTATYGYDNLDRLTGVAKPGLTQTYAYDAVGNRSSLLENGVNTTYAANNLNQYTQVNSTALTYDARGNLTNDGSLVMTYDTDNRLTSVVSPTTVVDYQYDYSNRLITKTMGGAATRYVYDGWQVIAEVDSGGSILKKYVTGPRFDEILAQKTSSQAVYLTRDGLGSTREITDSTGAVLQRFEYDAFGALTLLDALGNPIVGGAALTNYLFTGRELQPESGLYNYRNRFYHSGLGRFLQTDPAGFIGGINFYGYVSNNPVLLVDPLGLVSPEFVFTTGNVTTPKGAAVSAFAGSGRFGQPGTAAGGSFDTSLGGYKGTSRINVDGPAGPRGHCNSVVGPSGDFGVGAGTLDLYITDASPGVYDVDITVASSASGTGTGGAQVAVTTVDGRTLIEGAGGALAAKGGAFSPAPVRTTVRVLVGSQGRARVATYTPSVTVSKGSGSGQATGVIRVNSIVPVP